MPKQKDKNRELTEQENIFVDEYFISLDPEKSARKAKYSITTAKKQAHKWARAGKQNPKPHIWRAIKKRLVTKNKQPKEPNETEITAERVIKEMGRLGFSNVQDFVGEDNVIKDISTLPRHVAAAVKGIETERVYEYDEDGKATGHTDKVKLRFHGKGRSLTDLGKQLGIYEKDHRQIADGLLDLLKEISSNGSGLPINERKAH